MEKTFCEALTQEHSGNDLANQNFDTQMGMLNKSVAFYHSFCHPMLYN